MHSDESIILKTPNVFVKSLPFEAILTNKRIILVDRKKDLIPAKDILLATVRDIEPGENAIRDQIINLSIITTTGETRQVVLTFSREAGGNRKRERDEWAKALKQHTSSSFQQAIRKVLPVFDQEPVPKSQGTPVPKIEIAGRPPVKKEIDAVQPLKKIVETSNAPPKPVETTSLPEGTFCTTCGNRVPPGSLFCNRCGAKITPPGKEPAAESLFHKAPEPPVIPLVVLEVPPGVERATVQEPPHLPTVTAAQLERKERPIEDVIRSIEPLIEGSVPRSEQAPLVQSMTASPGSVTPQKPGVEQITVPVITTPPVMPPAILTPSPSPKKRSIFPQLFLKKDLPQQPVPAGAPPTPPPPQRSKPSGSRKKTYITIAVIVFCIIAIAGGGFVYMKYRGGTPPVQAPVETVPPTIMPTTPLPTTLPTPSPIVTTALPTTPPPPLVPPTGVWIKVNYPGGWKGSFGVPGNLPQVTGNGDQFYQIPAGDGIVQVSIQKNDGSGNELVVDIYKNGVLVQRGNTTKPRGTVEYLVDLKVISPAVTPTVKRTTVIINTTQTQTPTTPTGNVTTVKTTAPVTTTIT
ncbi:MAG: hypothetical protein NT112_03120, partial [Methanoregula sp.]|nr:hypothetical protein [Methanoregula sp.]